MSQLSGVLYSGGQNASNAKLHQALSDLVGMKSKKSITYIPYCYDFSKIYYNRFVKRYKKFGFNEYNILHADRPTQENQIKRMLNSDVVYMAGGNTFYMLYHLKKSGVFELLKFYAKTGGILAGLSAGAIIMTPDIDLAAYPSFDRDENEVGLTDFKSLNLVDFEFFPHFNPKHKRLVGALKRHAREKKRTVLASSDGSGIVLDNGVGHFIGRNNFEINQ